MRPILTLMRVEGMIGWLSAQILRREVRKKGGCMLVIMNQWRKGWVMMQYGIGGRRGGGREMATASSVNAWETGDCQKKDSKH